MRVDARFSYPLDERSNRALGISGLSITGSGGSFIGNLPRKLPLIPSELPKLNDFGTIRVFEGADWLCSSQMCGKALRKLLNQDMGFV
jgi:hypothetical protein